MFYFKFTDQHGNEMYASITVQNADKATPERKQKFIEELKKICLAETLEEISKEEYDRA